MSKKPLTEQLAEVLELLKNDPENQELLKQKADIELSMSRVANMQAGKKTDKAEKPKGNFVINGSESKNFINAEVYKLEKKYTGKKDQGGNDLFELREEKLLRTVKILKENLPIHSEQEENTLLRYKEV